MVAMRRFVSLVKVAMGRTIASVSILKRAEATSLVLFTAPAKVVLIN